MLKKFNNWHIVVVGCGGTGSNLVPHLSQLVYSLKSEKISIVLVDQDMVEPGNIGRQFFSEPEVGENKASTLQMRYSSAWGINISYHPHYITDDEVLTKLLIPSDIHGEKVMPILISCVDNNFSRQVFHKIFNQSKNLIYLDAGNSEFVGQVVMGMRYNNKTIQKPVAEYFPEILTDQDEIQVGGTCGRNAAKQPQNLMANLWAATIILGFLNNIIAMKETPANMVTFNAKNLVARPDNKKRSSAKDDEKNTAHENIGKGIYT